MNSLSTYQPSGKYSGIVFVYFTLFVLVGAPTLGYAYTYAEESRVKLLSLVIILLFPLLVFSVLTVVCLNPAKVRNPKLATVLGIASGLALLYCHLCFWPTVNMRLPMLETLVSLAFPSLDFEQVFDGGHGVDFFRLARWSLEGVYLLAVLGFGCRIFALRPFSETKNRWFVETDLPPMEPLDDAEKVQEALAAGRYQGIAKLQPDSAKKSHSVFTLFHLEDEFYLSIKNRKLPYPRNYKALGRFEDTSILTRVRIDAATGHALKKLLPKSKLS